MTDEERIARLEAERLEAEIKDLQEQLDMAYDDLDRRIEEAASKSSYKLTLAGIIISAIIGIIQIVVAILK